MCNRQERIERRQQRREERHAHCEPVTTCLPVHTACQVDPWQKLAEDVVARSGKNVADNNLTNCNVDTAGKKSGVQSVVFQSPETYTYCCRGQLYSANKTYTRHLMLDKDGELKEYKSKSKNYEAEPSLEKFFLTDAYIDTKDGHVLKGTLLDASGQKVGTLRITQNMLSGANLNVITGYGSFNAEPGSGMTSGNFTGAQFKIGGKQGVVFIGKPPLKPYDQVPYEENIPSPSDRRPYNPPAYDEPPIINRPAVPNPIPEGGRRPLNDGTDPFAVPTRASTDFPPLTISASEIDFATSRKPTFSRLERREVPLPELSSEVPSRLARSERVENSFALGVDVTVPNIDRPEVVEKIPELEPQELKIARSATPMANPSIDLQVTEPTVPEIKLSPQFARTEISRPKFEEIVPERIVPTIPRAELKVDLASLEFPKVPALSAPPPELANIEPEQRIERPAPMEIKAEPPVEELAAKKRADEAEEAKKLADAKERRRIDDERREKENAKRRALEKNYEELLPSLKQELADRGINANDPGNLFTALSEIDRVLKQTPPSSIPRKYEAFYQDLLDSALKNMPKTFRGRAKEFADDYVPGFSWLTGRDKSKLPTLLRMRDSQLDAN
ncbi:MAG: hypothetical protein KBC84_04740 [Proteobacteria bacterium]|nr:hypothetical protein [Pseudomonadota bacterium]